MAEVTFNISGVVLKAMLTAALAHLPGQGGGILDNVLVSVGGGELRITATDRFIAGHVRYPLKGVETGSEPIRTLLGRTEAKGLVSNYSKGTCEVTLNDQGELSIWSSEHGTTTIGGGEDALTRFPRVGWLFDEPTYAEDDTRRNTGFGVEYLESITKAAKSCGLSVLVTEPPRPNRPMRLVGSHATKRGLEGITYAALYMVRGVEGEPVAETITPEFIAGIA